MPIITFCQNLVKIELSGTEAVKIDNYTYMYKTGGMENLLSMLMQNGYIFQEQIGSLLIFKHNDELVNGILQPVTSRYTLLTICSK